MDNINWNLVIQGVSSLMNALPQDKETRKWVVIGTLAAVALIVFTASQHPGPEAAGPTPGPPSVL